jgi:hypothetical protein
VQGLAEHVGLEHHLTQGLVDVGAPGADGVIALTERREEVRKRIRARSGPYRATPSDLARYPTPSALCFARKAR